MSRGSLAACAAIVAGAALLSREPQRLSYPPAPRGGVVETLHGVTVPDPYRWLERLDDPAVKNWVTAQSAVSSRYFAGLAGRDVIRSRLERLGRYSRVNAPWREAAQLFFLRNDGTQVQPSLYTSEAGPGQDREPRLLFDPNREWPGGSVAVRDYAISPDGRLLAYATAQGGADAATEHVRELATGRDLDDQLPDVANYVCWTRASRGFFYFRTRAFETPAGGTERERQLLYHVMGQSQSQDRLIERWRGNYRWGYCMTSEDGRWGIAVVERGPLSEVYTMRLDGQHHPERDAPLVRLFGESSAMFTPLDVVRDTLYLATDLDAPRQRVVAVNLAEGGTARARTVVREAPDVIEQAAIAGDRIVIEYLVDASSRLRLFTFRGDPAGEVMLPGAGSIGELSGRPSSPDLFYSFRSYLAPATVYRFDLRGGASTPFQPPESSFDARPYETRQVFYSSRGGTRVPMFITARRDLRRDGSSPTLLSAYGGYGSSITPRYLPDLPLWLESGGIYAEANVRGGGEYGEAWHRAGMLDKKQNSFDDFIAAAEYLISERYTSSRRLAIFGHSNGGLLVGAMVTQRPDLFAAGVASAGHHDMLRYHKFTAGAGWILEYGSPDDATAFRYLLQYSPLHRVRNGTCYPATLLLVADHDDRVVPSHSYKFAAALQAAQWCDQPILLRVAHGASHSYASTAEQVSELTDMWAFIADRTKSGQ
jgi:prolyl oligopeptidase